MRLMGHVLLGGNVRRARLNAKKAMAWEGFEMVLGSSHVARNYRRLDCATMQVFGGIGYVPYEGCL